MCSGKFNQSRGYLEEKCPSRHVPADQLDELVWKDLCEVLSHPESITDALERAHGGQWLPQELKARQKNLRQGRAALSRQLERLTEAYLGGVIPLAEYQRRRKDLEGRDEALVGQEEQLRAQSHQHMELAGIAGSIEGFCERVRAGLASATFEQKRSLVELLIDRVIVTDEEVEIRYVIPTDPSSEKVRFCHLRSDYLHYPPPWQEGSRVLRARQQLLPVNCHPLLGPLPGPRLHHLLRGHLRRVPDDLCRPAQSLLYPILALIATVVGRVQPQVRKAREMSFGVLQERLDPVSVHEVGAMDLRLDHQSLGIDQEVSLAALDLLTPIVAAFFAANPGRFKRLAVNYPGTGLGVPLEAHPYPLA